MAKEDALYKAFTGGGALTSRWLASGVKTSYDPDTKDLSFELPIGWTDKMDSEDRSSRSDEWCLDAPTFNVNYTLRLTGEDAHHDREVTLIATEHDDGTIEFRTDVGFEALRGVRRGQAFDLSVSAKAELVKKTSKTLLLFKGEAVVPLEGLWLSENTPGFFFVVEAGFTLSVHTLVEERGDGEEETVRLTHVSLLGRMDNLENA